MLGTSSKNTWVQLSPEKGLVASACPSVTRSPQLSSLQRDSLKGPVGEIHFCSRAWGPG